ncbi:MAG: GDYXXLXY domain-containing protein [Bacteroidota bacterium]
MNKKKILFLLFVLVALAQLYVPASMIIIREEVLDTGTEYKFKIRPVDPNDPFRGKYITLYFEENTYEIDSSETWETGEKIYVSLIKDNEGFMKIHSVSRSAQSNNVDFIEAKVDYVSTYDIPHELVIEYPFNRYYMEESKAPVAETVYFEASQDTSQVAYALVYIKKGEAVLNGVFIDDQPIEEIVESAVNLEK